MGEHLEALAEGETYPLQGYLSHKNPPPRRTLQWPDAKGPIVVLGGWVFLISERPL